MLLLYGYDVFFENTLEMPKSLLAYQCLGKHCMHISLSVDGSNMKVTIVKTQNKDKKCTMYRNKALDIIESCMYVGLEVYFNHR